MTTTALDPNKEINDAIIKGIMYGETVIFVLLYFTMYTRRNDEYECRVCESYKQRVWKDIKVRVWRIDKKKFYIQKFSTNSKEVHYRIIQY